MFVSTFLAQGFNAAARSLLEIELLFLGVSSVIAGYDFYVWVPT
jgi:hypothetical protein